MAFQHASSVVSRLRVDFEALDMIWDSRAHTLAWRSFCGDVRVSRKHTSIVK